MDNYDIYHQWLGISPEEQPPSLYRLLGLSDFEHDPEVIRNAAERQALHVRRLARGEFTDVGQELLNELAQAKLILLSEEKRSAYDESLRMDRQTLMVDAEPDYAEDVTSDDIGQPPKSDSQIKSLRLATAKATVITVEDLKTDPPKDRWILGYHNDCDVRINHDTVSGIHCQLTLGNGKLYVSDLNSTNGTYVNQSRLVETKKLRADDLLTLGRDHRVILPRALLANRNADANTVFVGTNEGNEFRLESEQVSRFHAKLVILPGSTVVEDLDSKYGTYVIREGQEPVKIKRFRLRMGDVVCFANVRIDANMILQLGPRSLD